MRPVVSILLLCTVRALFVGVAVLVGGVVGGGAQEAGNSTEVRAAGVVGSNDVAVISLIRELSAWKERALKAEELLARAGVASPSGQSGTGAVAQSASVSCSVLNSLEDERIVIFSLGREKGALQGALVNIGGQVVAKIVESREAVSAAVVDNSYKGKLVMLEGLPVKLAVR